MSWRGSTLDSEVKVEHVSVGGACTEGAGTVLLYRDLMWTYTHRHTQLEKLPLQLSRRVVMNAGCFLFRMKLLYWLMISLKNFF